LTSKKKSKGRKLAKAILNLNDPQRIDKGFSEYFVEHEVQLKELGALFLKNRASASHTI